MGARGDSRARRAQDEHPCRREGHRDLTGSPASLAEPGRRTLPTSHGGPGSRDRSRSLAPSPTARLVPRQLGDVPLRLEASEKLHEVVAEARRWLHSAEGAAGEEDGTAVAGALLKLSNAWEIRLHNVTRGLRYRVRHSTQLGFCRPTRPGGTVSLRPGEHSNGSPRDYRLGVRRNRAHLVALANAG